MRIPRSWLLLALCLLPQSRADVRACQCDVALPETLDARECALCKEAEKQPSDATWFFLRDVNPNKPHRWLALPRFHGNRPQQLHDMTPEQRTAYWTAAIAKARENWPADPWGIALNSTERRTQCHLHLHIGKLLPNLPDEDFVVVDQPSEIPLQRDGDGIWIHSAGNRLHVHAGISNGELNLER